MKQRLLKISGILFAMLFACNVSVLANNGGGGGDDGGDTGGGGTGGGGTGGGGTTTTNYYSKATAIAIGAGKVYISSQEGDATADKCMNSEASAEKVSTSTTHAYYFYAKADKNNKFVGWYADQNCEGKSVALPNPSHLVTASSTDPENPTLDTFYAKFVEYVDGITNPNGNDDPRFGWITEGNVSHLGGQDDKGLDGKVGIFELQSEGETTSMWQKVNNLTESYYLLSVDCQADENSETKIFAGDTEVEVSSVSWKTYTVCVKITGGDLKIGASSKSKGGDAWAYVDNFRLTKLNGDFSKVLTVGSAGYATLCLPFPAQAPDGVDVYTAAYNSNKKNVTLYDVDGVIPANTGVVVKAASGDYEFTYSTQAEAEIEINDLVGVTKEEDFSDVVGIPYLLSKPSGQEIGFYKWSGKGNLGANKAYLLVSEKSGVKTFFSFGSDDVDAVQHVEVSGAASEIYDVEGRKLNVVPARGMYIKNGKKYMVK